MGVQPASSTTQPVTAPPRSNMAEPMEVEPGLEDYMDKAFGEAKEEDELYAFLFGRPPSPFSVKCVLTLPISVAKFEGLPSSQRQAQEELLHQISERRWQALENELRSLRGALQSCFTEEDRQIVKRTIQSEYSDFRLQCMVPKHNCEACIKTQSSCLVIRTLISLQLEGKLVPSFYMM